MLNCDKDSGAISIGFSSSANWLSTMKLLMIILTSSSLFTAFFSLLLFLRSMVCTSTIVYQYTGKCIFYSIMYLTAFPGAQFFTHRWHIWSNDEGEVPYEFFRGSCSSISPSCVSQQ